MDTSNLEPMPWEVFWFGLQPGDKVIKEWKDEWGKTQLVSSHLFKEYLNDGKDFYVLDHNGGVFYRISIDEIEVLHDNVIGLQCGNRGCNDTPHGFAYYGI
jgi:hypothetical protein